MVTLILLVSVLLIISCLLQNEQAENILLKPKTGYAPRISKRTRGLDFYLARANYILLLILLILLFISNC